MKKLATLAGSMVLFVATFMPVLANSNSCGNATSGPLSWNECTINNTSNVTVNNVNDAHIVNNVTARSNTGNNSASSNTLGGTISTGNATLNTTVSTVANINTTTVSGGPAPSSNAGMNQITGPDSDNFVDINNRQRIDVYNSNTATVNNTINVTSNAGDNVADFNTGPASVITGNARLGLSLFNHINDSATGISTGVGGSSSLDGNGSDGNTGGNSTTGPLSWNEVTINNTVDVAVNNVNDLNLRNWVETLANSGRNSASFNTLGGSVLAGNAYSNIGVDNQGNVNTTTVEVAMGSFANDGGNGVTGPDSDNFVDLLNNQNVAVDNWNNKCLSHNAERLECKDLGVFNYDYDEAISGDNVADFNTGLGGVSAGLADLMKTIMTHLNDTLTMIQI